MLDECPERDVVGRVFGCDFGVLRIQHGTLAFPDYERSE
jgi:hypothetical protein